MAQLATPLTDVPPLITINADGSHHPASVNIVPGGSVRFEINFPPGTTHCTVPLGEVTFQSARVQGVNNPGGTIKVGS
jgi:hypothetical protein